MEDRREEFSSVIGQKVQFQRRGETVDATVVDQRPGQLLCQVSQGRQVWLFERDVRRPDGSSVPDTSIRPGPPSGAPGVSGRPSGMQYTPGSIVPNAAASMRPSLSAIEEEVSGLSWGGFLWGWIWAVGNRVWIGLLGLIPGLSLVMAIVLLLKGRRWAWEKGDWRSLDHFAEVQKRWVLWWFILIPVFGLGFGVLSSLAVYGVRKYVVNAKRAEARVALNQFGAGLLDCLADNPMPQTSDPVPADLAQVSGQKYQSAPYDWDQPAFACARFSLATPQMFQYQWVRGDANGGHIVASADLDGDGLADEELSLAVTCTEELCELGAIVDANQRPR